MVRRLTGAVLALGMALSMGAPAFAARDDDYGFTREGWYTDSTTQYGFMIDDTQVSYNWDVSNWWDYDEIYTGSAIYVPIGTINNNGDEVIASFSNLRPNKDNVQISTSVTQGAGYVYGIELVDGNKEKVDGLPNGAYLKIQLTSHYEGTGNGVKIVVNMGMSIKNTYYQDTDTQLTIRMMNPTVYVDRNTVYGARSCVTFYASSYSGNAAFDLGGNVRYDTSVSSGSRYVINMYNDPVASIERMYPNAYLEYYEFLTNRAFSGTGTLSIPVDSSKFVDGDGKPILYVYSVNEANNTLVAMDSGIAYDENYHWLYIATNRPGHYVLSNQALLPNVDAVWGNTLRSGYAEASSEAEPDAPSVASQASSGAASSASSASNANDSPNTGRRMTVDAGTEDIGALGESGEEETATRSGDVVINVDNPSGDNPPTGLPMVGLMGCTSLAAGCGSVVYWKRKRPFAKKKQGAEEER